jgi:HEAT repeat protein
MATFEALEKKVLALARRTVIMPIAEIRLEARLAELPGIGRRIKRLLAWTEHENLHVRRVGYHVIRRAKLFGAAGVTEALLRGLSDTAGWVRYDAAWALADRGLAEPAVLKGLKRLAGSQKPVSEDAIFETIDIDDSTVMARVQAANALAALKAAAKKPAR